MFDGWFSGATHVSDIPAGTGYIHETLDEIMQASVGLDIVSMLDRPRRAVPRTQGK